MECEVEGEFLSPEDFTKDSGWQLVAARRSSMSKRNAANASAADVQHNTGFNARRSANHAGIKSKIIRGPGCLRCPRKRQRSSCGPGRPVYQQVWTYRSRRRHMAGCRARFGVARHRHDVSQLQQNIMVISTPNRDNAARYVGIEGISVAGHRFEVSAYEAAPTTRARASSEASPLPTGPR